MNSTITLPPCGRSRACELSRYRQPLARPRDGTRPDSPGLEEQLPSFLCDSPRAMVHIAGHREQSKDDQLNADRIEDLRVKLGLSVILVRILALFGKFYSHSGGNDVFPLRTPIGKKGRNTRKDVLPSHIS